jgi:hypothetical protein
MHSSSEPCESSVYPHVMGRQYRIRLGTPSRFFSCGFASEMLRTSLDPPFPTTCLSHLRFVDVATLRVFESAHCAGSHDIWYNYICSVLPLSWIEIFLSAPYCNSGIDETVVGCYLFSSSIAVYCPTTSDGIVWVRLL